jgi:hypothetical protein
MYVTPTDPLPRNSQDPQTACEAAQAALVVSNMEQSVQNAYAASNMIAPPASFQQFGPGVVIDVTRSQAAQVAAGLPVVFQSPSVRTQLQGAPRVLPLNVTESEYNSCCTGGVVKPMQVAPKVPIMPQMISNSLVHQSLGGLMGYRRGMGAPWGDAGSRPSTPGWPVQGGHGTNWNLLAICVAAFAGVYALGKR